MTTPEFQAKHPKPWHFVVNKSGFSLRDANGNPIANLQLCNHHPGIPQQEWNRHMLLALEPLIPFKDGGTDPVGAHLWVPNDSK